MAPDPSPTVGQDEIEALLKQAQGGAAPAAATPAASAAAGPTISQNDIELLLSQAKGPGSSAGTSTPGVTVDQGEIEALMAGKSGGKPTSAPATAAAAKSATTSAPAATATTTAAEDASKLLSQNDIESLFAKAAPATPTPAKTTPAAGSNTADPSIAADDIELLLQQAEAALASIDQPSSAVPADVRTFKFEEFAGAPPSADAATIQLLRDVELDLRIELGRTQMQLEEVLHLRRGSVVPLDKLAGDPVGIYVNGRLIARGEVLVLSDNFCVRVAELIAGETAAAG